MKTSFTLFFLLFQLTAFAQTTKTEILIIGSDHLAQVYRPDKPASDVLIPKRQKELTEFAASIQKFKPDMVMVEELPAEQIRLDSLYKLYKNSTLLLEKLPDGRSEVYQLGFRIGKNLNLPKIYAVNAPGGTSQGILDNGTNIEVYKAAGADVRKMSSQKSDAFRNGEITLNAYLNFINQPELYMKLYRLRYIVPVRVTNGRFKNPDAMVDTAFINPAYIGAELTSVFKNRDYKIYSNIVTTAMAQKPKRILLIIGAMHIGSLRSILQDDPEFKLVDSKKYLK